MPAAALIAGLSLVGCSSGEGGAAEPTSAGTDPAASQVASTAPTTPPSAMTIEQIAAACLDGPAPVEVLTAGQDSEPVVATAPEGGNLCVGPVALTGDAVEKAEVVLGADQQWAVALTFTEEGIDRFNQVAELCFTSAEGICPTGRLAVLVDGRVVTAPSVQSPSFLRDQIQISGSFTEDEAGGLATAIDDGGITFRPVLVQLP